MSREERRKATGQRQRTQKYMEKAGLWYNQLPRFLRETYSIKILVKTFLLLNKKLKLRGLDREGKGGGWSVVYAMVNIGEQL